MEKSVAGDVVVVLFPFSDLTGSKRRPALVVASLPGNDLILCQITSQVRADVFSIPIGDADFSNGSLSLPSLVRCGKIFTADGRIVERRVGKLRNAVLGKVVSTIVQLIGKDVTKPGLP